MKTVRNTIQKQLILNAVRALKNHPTADEVYEEILKSSPNISRATVYRNLKLLSEQGEIRLRQIPGSPDRYDHMCTDHSHLRCKKCGRILDIETPKLPIDALTPKDSSGMKIDGFELTYFGLCPDCAKESQP